MLRPRGPSRMRLTTDYTALFTPFELAGKRLRNRIAHASITTLSTPAGPVTERLIQYHANRAAGGAALTELTWAPNSLQSKVESWVAATPIVTVFLCSVERRFSVPAIFVSAVTRSL